MECNKDEANRAKEIAEKKFESKDYLGSQKFALKAQSLYPGLNGIQHMLTTLTVYISSENTVNGEIDWYKVLDVNPNSDEDTIKKQYRKLALILHPDKNKSIGADGAFKLISEAWNLLSDKFQRSVYDQKRNVEKVVKPKISRANPKTEAQKGKPPKRKSTTSKDANTAPSNQKNHSVTPTFWTVCHRCRLQHEYLRMYLHQNLLCPACNMPYYAFEYPPPILQKHSQWNHFLKKNTGYSFEHQSHIPQTPTQWNHFMRKHTEGRGFSYSHPSDQTNFGWDPFSKAGGCPLADQAATAAQQVFEKSKRERENALNAMRKDREADLESEAGFMMDRNAVKRRKVGEISMREKKKSSLEQDKRGTTKTKITATENGKLNKSSVNGFSNYQKEA